jgi:outer membrane protein TolC
MIVRARLPRLARFSLAVLALPYARAQDPGAALSTLPETPSAAVPNASAVPGPAAADFTGVPLTVAACVDRALAKNFTVRIQQFTIPEAQDSVIIAQSAFDPTFGYTGQKTVTQDALLPGALNLVNGIAATHTNYQISELTVTQPVITGGTLSGNYSLIRQQTNPAINFPNPAYAANTSITVVQPLLQGAGTDYGRAAIESARLGVRIANLTFKSTVLTLVYNVETAYFNLLYAREQYKVQQDTLRLAQQLFSENTIKRQTGVLTDLDVMQARVGVATAQNQLILDEQLVHNAEDALLQDLGDREFKTAVGLVSFPPASEPSVSFDRSYKLARDHGPSLAVVQAVIEQYKLTALKAKRNSLPQLNVNGGAGWATSAHSDYQANFGNWNGYNWTAGVSVSIPWGMRANRALYRQAMASVHSEEVTLDQADQTLVVQVRAAVRGVQTNIASVRTSTNATQFAEKQYELQKAEFDAGLATSYDVLQAQNNLETSRVSELQAKVGLLVAIADLHFLEGSSLDLYHINLPE